VRNVSVQKKRLEAIANQTKKLGLAFLKNKRAMVGIGIILFFTVIALFAPFLTPYDPTLDRNLAGSGMVLAKPAWFRYLPGGDTLSENLDPVKDPEFSSMDFSKAWNVSITPAQFVSTWRTSALGTEGCLAVEFSRDGNHSPQVTFVRISSDFAYPFGGPPARFDTDIQLLVEDDDAIEVRPMFFIEDNTHGKRYDWGFGQHWDEDNITATTTQWTTPITKITSLAEIYDRKYRFNVEEDLATLMFSEPANYTFGLEIAFFDLPTNAGKDARVSVYVDKLDFKTYGTCFGLLGCEFQGRDIFSQLVYGTRISIYIGILAALVSVGLGLLVGLVSAYLGGVVDEALMRFTDALLVLPGLPLIIVLIAVLGTSVSNLIILIGFLGWMGFARVVRSQVLSLKERPFIEAAKAIGAGKSHIMFKHIVPNVMSLVYVTLATSVPGAIVAEAALSFLGYYDPSIMSWGRMLYDVQTKGSYEAYWWVLPPGMCIAAISIAFILLGYALDEILNPRLRIRR